MPYPISDANISHIPIWYNFGTYNLGLIVMDSVLKNTKIAGKLACVGIFLGTTITGCNVPLQNFAPNTAQSGPVLKSKMVLDLEASADSGNALSQYRLGEMYYRGQIGKSDPVKAEYYLQKAVDQNLLKPADNFMAVDELFHIHKDEYIKIASELIRSGHKQEAFPYLRKSEKVKSMEAQYLIERLELDGYSDQGLTGDALNNDGYIRVKIAADNYYKPAVDYYYILKAKDSAVGIDREKMEQARIDALKNKIISQFFEIKNKYKNDFISQVLNFTQFRNEGGTSEQFWYPKEKCTYELLSIQRNGDLTSGQAIDINKIKYKTISVSTQVPGLPRANPLGVAGAAIVSDSHGVVFVGSLVNASDRPFIQRVNRGWHEIFSKGGCAGSVDKF